MGPNFDAQVNESNACKSKGAREWVISPHQTISKPLGELFEGPTRNKGNGWKTVREPIVMVPGAGWIVRAKTGPE